MLNFKENSIDLYTKEDYAKIAENNNQKQSKEQESVRVADDSDESVDFVKKDSSADPAAHS